MRRIITLFSLLLFVMFAQSQKEFTGTVIDAGTREALKDISVQATHSNIQAKTDLSGFFTIQLNSKTLPENGEAIYFTVVNNSVLWGLDGEVTISLYSMDGATLFSALAEKNGEMHLAVPASGYYILTIQSAQKLVKFWLYSDGNNLLPGTGRNLSSLVSPSDSSIIFFHPNYFSREIKLANAEQFEHLNLLKKEYAGLDYFNELLRYEAFDMLQSTPPVTNFGEIQSIKALYDFVADEMYYTNVKKYPSHYLFARDILGFQGSDIVFFYSQYNDAPSRFLNGITINYHKNIDKYVFEFASYDMIDCEGIQATYKKLLETSYFGDKLYFYANNQRWKNCLDIPIITSEELYLGQNYQALNNGENYGYLRKVDINDLPSTYLGRHDIVLLNGIPNDLSVVSGIITTEFQTPLSHINILSYNRQTPNMALRDGWENPQLDSLLGELVFLKVESNSFLIRKANIEEATTFWSEKEPHNPVTLEKDVETSGLIELNEASILSTKTIGGKAANFAELVNLGNIPVPENYFAIPFYYYQKHLANNGIDVEIENMLLDGEFFSNQEYRKNKLEEIRNQILQAPLDSELINMVSARINNFSEFSSFKFRSSTNAEDLENFSGAGLYDSYSAKKNHSTKTIANAIRGVWASLWNLRAFDEREYYKIDQTSVAMGILVHRAFSDEDANGVVITKNLYNVNHAYTINVQYQEYSIVYPEPGIIHDQILVYTINLDDQKYTIEYLSQSNIPALNGKTVMTDEELYELAEYCTIIKEHYYNNIPNNCNCEYSNFAVDLEIKVDSEVENRKIYIKQARIYGTY